jgi:LmbE family N-acetylglucosaminyl deacetylase
MKNILLLLFVFLSVQVDAQQPVFKTSSEILHELKTLKTVATVLYIAAHPDDENTRLISYLTKEKGYRVAYLSLTRGEGGQNLIGDEQGHDLGILRTQELLAARRIDGAEQYFTSAYDFGYSKTPEETFRKWNKEQLLMEIVFLIRKLRPDVIIARFPTTGEGGHGHHTASAILAEEAYDLAADPEKYKEFELPAWKAKRLLWNTFNFGSNNTTSEDQLKINVGGFNPLLGKSYGEIAAEARSEHRCQAFGTERRRGDQFEYFKTIKGEAPVNDLMDGVNTSLSRIDVKNVFTKILDPIISTFSSEDPSRSVPGLVNLLAQIHKLIGEEVFIKDYNFYRIKLHKLIFHCAGIYTEIISSSPAVTKGEEIKLKWNFIKRSDVVVKPSLITTFGDHLPGADSLPVKNQFYSWTPTFNERIFSSNPYMFAAASQGKQLITIIPKWWEKYGLVPFKGEYRFETRATVRCRIYDMDILMDVPVSYKYIDPSIGEIYQPLVIAPLVTLNFTEDAYFIQPGQNKKIKLLLKSFAKADGKASLEVPAGWKVSPENIPVSFSKADELKEIEFTIENTGISIDNNSSVRAMFTFENGASDRAFKKIAYEHIPAQIIFPVSEALLRSNEFKTNVKKIGYISGAGDKVSNVLTQLGFNVTLLIPSEISTAALQNYETIITGVRAFNTLEEMKSIEPMLMNYVQTGGTVVMQYNTANGLLHKNFGPYPFELSRERVTEEDAKVTILNDKDPALNYPNKITETDFHGWVQEFGLYYPTKVDSQYRRIISMADEKSAQLENSVLIANYGKGKYVYTSLSFFRQLPAGVPGAIRLFINLISKNIPLPEEKVNSKDKNGSGRK